VPLSADSDVVFRLPPVRAALAQMEDADAVRRCLARDASLWSADAGIQAAIAHRFGWLDAAGGDPAWSAEMAALVHDVRAAELSHVVLAGMGGSSLAPEVFARVFRGLTAGATLTVLDSTHPGAVAAALDEADLAHTLVVIASKSGSTEETACFASRAAALVPSSSHLIAITDPGSQLDEQASAGGWRAVLRNPPDIGGRFSALSLFGMAPAALLGVDVSAVWAHAADLLRACGPDEQIGRNPAAQLAAFMAGFAQAGRDKLTLLLPHALAPLGDWIEQLVAESTGKQGVGIVPIVGEPPGPAEQYGADRAFVAYRVGDDGPEGAQALADAGQPVLFLDLPDVVHLGAEFLRWELATALAGFVLGVNPFDEPNVTESKHITVQILDELRGGGALPPPEHEDVGELLATLRPGDYLSIQAYLPPSVDTVAAIDRVRAELRERGLTSTFGWGPRFLHSTGQLHKGGPDTVAVLQMVDSGLWEEPAPLPIPDRPYDFGTLVRAQAVGDLRALRAHHRRVAQVGVDGAAAVERLVEALLHRLVH
jgi:transaldolase/glucose-6-phosphate isomerase